MKPFPAWILAALLALPWASALAADAGPTANHQALAPTLQRYVAEKLLAGGVVQGRRILSAASIRQMTSRQTPAALKPSYGFGFKVAREGFGHGGADSTNLNVDPAHGLVTVLMVQNAGWRTAADGKKIEPAFQAAAVARFGR